MSVSRHKSQFSIKIKHNRDELCVYLRTSSSILLDHAHSNAKKSKILERVLQENSFTFEKLKSHQIGPLLQKLKTTYDEKNEMALKARRLLCAKYLAEKIKDIANSISYNKNELAISSVDHENLKGSLTALYEDYLDLFPRTPDFKNDFSQLCFFLNELLHLNAKLKVKEEGFFSDEEFSSDDEDDFDKNDNIIAPAVPIVKLTAEKQPSNSYAVYLQDFLKRRNAERTLSQITSQLTDLDLTQEDDTLSSTYNDSIQNFIFKRLYSECAVDLLTDDHKSPSFPLMSNTIFNPASKSDSNSTLDSISDSQNTSDLLNSSDSDEDEEIFKFEEESLSFSPRSLSF